MDAFSNSEYTYWWGPISAIRLWSEERILRRFADPNTQQFKVVDDANGTVVAWAKWDPPSQMTGLAEGFVVYNETCQPITTSLTPATQIERGGGKADGQASTKRYAPGPPEGSNSGLFKTFFDGIADMEKKYQAEKKLVLTHLCTRHNYQGRGIGSALLRSVLDLADREGLSAYLEATRVGLPLYRKLGYKVVDTLDFDRKEAGFATPATL
ncbi:hypothetical protein ONZ43_g2436 [Nemania bipapillata]|uniref:Uncharacterized protein n=1 Tax=Nemania bipapillata TaxID=110536 RepID=A0ACC2J0P5_9PEZI|nr:hypothetical protein ONZ43_g2436 [Nemania bipapillata]